MKQCTEELENTGLVLLNRPASALDLSQAALALRWGAIRPDSSKIKPYAAVIGEEELVILVHPQNTIQQISADDLEAIYTGRMRTWKTAAPANEIQVLVYPEGEETQEIFENIFLNSSPGRAQITSLVPDPAAMRETIAKNPGAIGFLPRRWVDSTVKTLPVENLDPVQLRHPILALSQSEPGGQEKEWLVCLQEMMSE